MGRSFLRIWRKRMLANPEWRDYVNENTKLVFDLDTYCYQAASSNETEVMTVIHKESGKEVFKEKDKPILEKVCVNPETLEQGYIGSEWPRYVEQDSGKTENVKFKNKTDFWGRTKKTITGWLGDLNVKREAEGKEPFTREDFELSFHKEAGEISYAIAGLKRKIQRVQEYLGIEDTIFMIGGGDNHRHELLLPANPNNPDNPEEGCYKGQREEKPVLLDEVRDYAVKVLGAKDYSGSGVEADDVLNFYANLSHKAYKKTGKHRYIIIAMDKDTLSFNGLIFNYYRAPKSSVWKHPHCYLVDGLGQVDLVDGKVKGKGLYHLAIQLLTQDTADNYYATRHAKIRFGDKDVYKLLSACTTPKEVIQAVYDQYQTWFPEGTKFTAWTGEEVEMTALEWLETIFSCAYMLKSWKDETTFKTYMDAVGVEYEEEVCKN